MLAYKLVDDFSLFFHQHLSFNHKAIVNNSIQFQKMNIIRWLVLGYLVTFDLSGYANNYSALKEVENRILDSSFVHQNAVYKRIFEGCKTISVSEFVCPKDQFFYQNDSLPTTIDKTVLIPFEYKQSSLNYRSTFQLIDSVIKILHSDDSITFSIDGYAYFEEASEEICYWLSMNRALAVKNYVLGQGIDSLRMLAFKGNGNQRSIQRKLNKQEVQYHYTAEITLNYPIPPPPLSIQDIDGDGIPDMEDSCRSEYGERASNGCPDKNSIIVPFELQQSSLYSSTYHVLDSVIVLMQNDPTLTIAIQGFAYKTEGIKTVCNVLAKERADISRRYLLSRQVSASRIDSIKNANPLKQVTAGRNPWEISRNARAEIILLYQ
jgi:outer membrane protein OmpA-like peptidoglycan-associated protein